MEENMELTAERSLEIITEVAFRNGFDSDDNVCYRGKCQPFELDTSFSFALVRLACRYLARDEVCQQKPSACSRESGWHVGQEDLVHHPGFCPCLCRYCYRVEYRFATL